MVLASPSEKEVVVVVVGQQNLPKAQFAICRAPDLLDVDRKPLEE
jgi:hypothetical protein